MNIFHKQIINELHKLIQSQLFCYLHYNANKNLQTAMSLFNQYNSHELLDYFLSAREKAVLVELVIKHVCFHYGLYEIEMNKCGYSGIDRILMLNEPLQDSLMKLAHIYDY